MTYNGFIMSAGTALVVVGSKDGNWPTIIFGMVLLIWGTIFIAIEERRMNGKIKTLEDKGKNLEDKVWQIVSVKNRTTAFHRSHTERMNNRRYLVCSKRKKKI